MNLIITVYFLTEALGPGHITSAMTAIVTVTFMAIAKKFSESVTLKTLLSKEKMASTVLLWIYLLMLFRHCAHFGHRRNHLRGSFFVVYCHQA